MSIHTSTEVHGNYATLLDELVNTCRHLKTAGIEYRLGGSFALNIYAGKEIIASEDLDFFCKQRESHDAFVAMLVSQLGYTQTKQEAWTVESGAPNINTKLTSPTGLLVEVAWVNDIELSDAAHDMIVEGQSVSLYTLADLQLIYQECIDRKPGVAQKLKMIDMLIQQAGADE